MNDRQTLNNTAKEMREILSYKTIPFWLEKSIDEQYGGYFTCISENGKVNKDANKMIITQTRMLWGFSALKDFVPVKYTELLEYAARQGYDFIIKYFWDKQNGGFRWETNREGVSVDDGKLIYAQSFAIYTLSEYFLNYHDSAALEYAEKTFDLLQIYAADTLYGGYFENLENDWTISSGGIYAGDRKSLDIHMHLMEAFTVLYQASQKEIHRRKLKEVIGVIISHMINKECGYGLNQFDVSFKSLPAINIYRTWNADRESNEIISEPADTTSYGHNVELSWLLRRTCEVLGESNSETEEIIKKLLEHSLLYGYDYEFGGVYRDGIGNMPALVKDKEWWQNFESLVGYLNGYINLNDKKYLEAFYLTWEFIKKHFIIDEFGESRQLLSRTGTPVISGIGNAWKGIYHTGRAMAECISMIENN